MVDRNIINRLGLSDEQLNQQVAARLISLWRHTFYPYRVYLPFSQSDLARLDVGMPNIVTVPVDTGASVTERLDAVLAEFEGEYAAVVPAGFEIREFWLEDSLYGLIKRPDMRDCFELEDSTDRLWAAVLPTGVLRDARGDRARGGANPRA